MAERENQSGDGEVAICHICDRRFDTQEAMSRHLIDDHEGENLEADRPMKEEPLPGENAEGQ